MKICAPSWVLYFLMERGAYIWYPTDVPQDLVTHQIVVNPQCRFRRPYLAFVILPCLFYIISNGTHIVLDGNGQSCFDCVFSLSSGFCVRGKRMISLSRKGPSSTSQLLSMIRRCTIGQIKALVLVSQKTPGNKTEIELVQSYALSTTFDRWKSIQLWSILPEIEPVTSWFSYLHSTNWANGADSMLYQLQSIMQFKPVRNIKNKEAMVYYEY